MFQSLYDLINTYIFNGAVVTGEYTDLVCTLVATCGNLFFVAIPFIVVYKGIDIIFRGWR